MIGSDMVAPPLEFVAEGGVADHQRERGDRDCEINKIEHADAPFGTAPSLGPASVKSPFEIPPPQ